MFNFRQKYDRRSISDIGILAAFRNLMGVQMIFSLFLLYQNAFSAVTPSQKRIGQPISKEKVQSQVISGSVLLFPLKNSSDFTRPWNLAQAIPEYLSHRLARKHHVQFKQDAHGLYTSEASRLAVFSQNCSDNIDWIFAGKINEYGISKSGMGTGAVASFQSYSASLSGQFYSFDCKARQAHQKNVSWKIRDNELGVRVPYVYIPVVKDKYEKIHYSLEQAYYGDSVFEASVAGAINDSLAKLFETLTFAASHDSSQLKSITVESSIPKVPKAEVLYVKGTQVYVNLGSLSNISVGDSAVFYRNGDAILETDGKDTLGFVELLLGTGHVQTVKSEKLSIIQAQKIDQQVDRGDLVRIYK